jgi:hypothetical protein
MEVRITHNWFRKSVSSVLAAFEWTENLMTTCRNGMTHHSDSLLLCTLSILVRNKDAALESKVCNRSLSSASIFCYSSF